LKRTVSAVQKDGPASKEFNVPVSTLKGQVNKDAADEELRLFLD
jgi:hypothetical protein